MLNYGAADALTLAVMTLRKTSFVDRIQAASIAGFQSIGWRLEDFLDTQQGNLKEEAVIRLLKASKIKPVEIEFFRDWVGREDDPEYRDKERHLFELSDKLGAHHLKVAVFKPYQREAIVDSLKALCRRASAHNLIVGLEFMPYTPPVDSLKAAWGIVQAAAEPNAGLVIDVWHWARTATSAEELRLVPPERITSVELSDALATPMAELSEESRHYRRVPGEGAVDLSLFLRILTQHGVQAPLSVEIMSDELDAMPAVQAAQKAASATRSVLWEAMWQSLNVAKL